MAGKKDVFANAKFCDDCPFTVDFGPWVQTPRGKLPTKVKELNGKKACHSCPHHEERQQALAQAA